MFSTRQIMREKYINFLFWKTIKRSFVVVVLVIIGFVLLCKSMFCDTLYVFSIQCQPRCLDMKWNIFFLKKNTFLKKKGNTSRTWQQLKHTHAYQVYCFLIDLC